MDRVFVLTLPNEYRGFMRDDLRNKQVVLSRHQMALQSLIINYEWQNAQVSTGYHSPFTIITRMSDYHV